VAPSRISPTASAATGFPIADFSRNATIFSKILKAYSGHSAGTFDSRNYDMLTHLFSKLIVEEKR
jgi:hypothetical protein